MITKNSLPAEPSVTSTLPASTLTCSRALRDQLQLLFRAGGEEGHAGQRLDERIGRATRSNLGDSRQPCSGRRTSDPRDSSPGNGTPRRKVDSVVLKVLLSETDNVRTRPQQASPRRQSPCPRPSVSTSAPPTRSSRSSRPASRRHPQLRGLAHHPVGRRVLQDRRGPRRRGGQAPGDHQPRPHDPVGQAPHGHELDDRHRRQELQRAGDLGPHAAEAQARRRGLPRRHRHPGRHHRARLLRRRRAPGHQGGRRDRRPRGAAHHQRAHRGRARPTASTRTTTRPSSCSTSAAARSTCRSSRSATACSRSSPPHGNTHLGGDDWDQRVIDWLVERVQERPRRRPRGRQDGRAAPQGGGREGQDRALVAAGDHRSTCRSSPRPATARCTSTSRSPAPSSRSSPPISSSRAAARSSRRSATPASPRTRSTT